jgi:hypothetical protein
MNIVINPDLKAYIDPLTHDERGALERSLLNEGCRDALVLWGELLIDGHNRYELCQQHNLPYRTVQSTLFNSMEDVHLWMIEQHLGRRSVSDFQRGVLALRKREIMESRRASYLAESASRVPVEGPVRHGVEQPWEGELSPAIAALTQPFKSRDDLAKAARITNSQVLMIEKINKQAAPEVVAAVKAGSLSISAAAAISTLPEVEQKAAASAGTQQLRQVAKRVKEAKRKSVGSQLREADATHDGVSDLASDELQRLRKLVERLTDENKQLRQQVSNLLERTLPSRLGQAET